VRSKASTTVDTLDVRVVLIDKVPDLHREVDRHERKSHSLRALG
jgi:hypothetical protein